MCIFNNEWNVLIYNNNNKWDSTSFEKIYNINNYKDFWEFDSYIRYNSDIILRSNLYIMKKNILPIWNDEKNKNGGYWSIKMNVRDSLKIFMHILIYILHENYLIKGDNSDINGICISIKNAHIAVIQIWNSDYVKNKNVLHNIFIRDKFDFNIFYKQLMS